MRFKTKRWIMIAFFYVVLTAYEISNVQVVRADEPIAGIGIQSFVNKAELASSLTEDVIQTDPEAADILKYCLTEPNLENLAVLAEKYHNNEFFLAQLTYRLTDVNLIDPRAVIALADRLIAMNPDNAHYHYMKGCILLKMPGGSEKINAALEQFKQGNNLQEFTLPYNAYKPRIETLCEKAGMGILQRRRALPNETGWYSDLGIFISRSRGCYPKLDLDSFRVVSAELSKAADNVIRHAETFGNLQDGYLHLFLTERKRLIELDLTKEQARLVRYRLCRAIEINNKLQQSYLKMMESFFNGKWQESDPLSLCRPLPEATRETYKRVLSEKHSSDPNAPVRPSHKENAGLPENLYLASPEDLSAIIHERNATGLPIRDKLLWEVMLRGGHDIRPIALKALKDPNAQEILLKQAKWKDISVKIPLEEIFEGKMDELTRMLAPIHKDPNSIESLIIRVCWDDEKGEEKLEQTFENKMTELSEKVKNAEKTDELRTELKLLLKMDIALGGMSQEEYDSREQFLTMEQKLGIPLSVYTSDPDPKLTLQKNRERSSRVWQIISDANIPELLEDDSDTHVNVPGRRLVESLLDMAGALAFLSEPDEAKARFSRILELAGEWPENSVTTQPKGWELISPSAKIWNGRLWWQPCLFYRYLWGVPKVQTSALLKDYLVERRLTYPFEENELADVLRTSGDRELAEWVFKKIAGSPPKIEQPYYPNGIPIGRPFHISEVRQEKRIEDVGHGFLEAAFGHLNAESMPLLIENLHSGNAQLRAFIVWRLTSLDYGWSAERLIELIRDDNWKVRLNIIWALDERALTGAANDKNPIVRIMAKTLQQAKRG